MKKFRDFLGRPTVTAVLLALALVLLGGSTIGGTRAALTFESQIHDSRMKLDNIGVVLMENGNPVEGTDKLLKDLLARNGNDPQPKIGKKYSESLTVKNTGTIDEYVRVTVYKYWIDKTGKKSAEMDANWIELGFVTGAGWTIDGSDPKTGKFTGSTTEERTVLYYSSPLSPGQESSPFLDSITIKEEPTHKVTKTESTVGGVTTITWTYDYNGAQFCLEAHVDGVQTHSAGYAKISAWGVNK